MCGARCVCPPRVIRQSGLGFVPPSRFISPVLTLLQVDLRLSAGLCVAIVPGVPSID